MYGRKCRNIPDLAATKGAVATDYDSVYVFGVAPSMSVAARKNPLEGRLLPFSPPGFLSSSRKKPYAMRVPLGVAAAAAATAVRVALIEPVAVEPPARPLTIAADCWFIPHAC